VTLSFLATRLRATLRGFGVPSGKLLGFIISHCGIEANP
jgi:hypothetical protein